MPHIIAEPCIGTKDTSCVEVCPVDCIHPTKANGAFEKVGQLYIDPDTCIDCAACEAVCPVNAIYYQEDVPADQKEWIDINTKFFKDVPAAERTFRPRTERTP